MQTENWSGAEKKAFEEATIRHLRNDVEFTKLLIEQKLQDSDKPIFLFTYFMIKLKGFESWSLANYGSDCYLSKNVWIYPKCSL